MRFWIRKFCTAVRTALGSAISSGSPVTDLNCPNFAEPANATPWYRQMCYNEDAAGGTPVSWNDPSLWVGRYGLSVSPASFVVGGAYVYGDPVMTYQLGAKMSLFRPDQFLIIESFAGNDVSYGRPSATTPPGNSRGRLMILPWAAAWCRHRRFRSRAARYTPAFRHAFKRASNFLFIDGRVQTMSPKDDVADHSTSYSTSNVYVRIGPSHMALN